MRRIEPKCRDAGDVDEMGIGFEIRIPILTPAKLRSHAGPVGTQTTNDEVTPGNIGELTGSRLRYDPAAADEGIFFVAAADGAETKVDCVQLNKPASQVFMVPALVAGDYEFQV